MGISRRGFLRLGGKATAAAAAVAAVPAIASKLSGADAPHTFREAVEADGGEFLDPNFVPYKGVYVPNDAPGITAGTIRTSDMQILSYQFQEESDSLGKIPLHRRKTLQLSVYVDPEKNAALLDIQPGYVYDIVVDHVATGLRRGNNTLHLDKCMKGICEEVQINGEVNMPLTVGLYFAEVV
jgi:hypothetical protein